MTERVSAQLRFEFFNVLNTPIFFIASQDVNSVNFGRVTQTLNAPRVVQFAARISFSDPSEFIFAPLRLCESFFKTTKKFTQRRKGAKAQSTPLHLRAFAPNLG